MSYLFPYSSTHAKHHSTQRTMMVVLLPSAQVHTQTPTSSVFHFRLFVVFSLFFRTILYCISKRTRRSVMACRSIPSARTAGFPLNLKSSFAHVVVVVFVAAAVAVAIVLSDIVSSHCSLTSTSLERALPCLSAPATILPTKRLKGHISFACDVFTNPTIQQHWIPLKSYSEQLQVLTQTTCYLPSSFGLQTSEEFHL